MALLSAANYAEIRAALDVSLNDLQLPDAIIAYDMYAGRGQRQVLAAIPTAESLAGDDLLRARNAAMFYTAAFIAPAIPNIVSKSMGGERAIQFDIDWEARADGLRAAAAEELAAIQAPEEDAPNAPTLITRVSGRRGY